jgi:hypothetical protein
MELRLWDKNVAIAYGAKRRGALTDQTTLTLTAAETARAEMTAVVRKDDTLCLRELVANEAERDAILKRFDERQWSTD